MYGRPDRVLKTEQGTQAVGAGACVHAVCRAAAAWRDAVHLLAPLPRGQLPLAHPSRPTPSPITTARSAKSLEDTGFNVAGTRTKAADYMDMLITGMLAKAAQIGGAGPAQVEAIAKMCDVLRRLMAPAPLLEDIERLKVDAVEAVCLVEQHLPLSEMVLIGERHLRFCHLRGRLDGLMLPAVGR